MKFEEKHISGIIIGVLAVMMCCVAFVKPPVRARAEAEFAQPARVNVVDETVGIAPAEPLKVQAAEPQPEAEAYTGDRPAWVTTFGKLNVREQANTESSVIGHFVYRQEVTITGTDVDGFYAVAGEDSRTGEVLNGYCHGDYLSEAEPEEPYVYLDVPAYKQTDGRWGDVTLGSSKRKMKDIGCATTCLAMSKSFLTKTMVYPDDMEELLWYDKKGNLGWPKTYTWTTDSTYYLETIFEKLHEGIPVLVGSEKKNGRPHWVLVVGYCGDGENFYPSDFLINDPLPDNRTNLKQFFETYPVFYKMAFYTG